MIKKIVFGLSGVCFAFCGLSLASSYSFKCPNASDVSTSDNQLVSYAALTPGSPPDLGGPGYGISAGWSGQLLSWSGVVDHYEFSSIYLDTTRNVLSCNYVMYGTNKSGNPQMVAVSLLPGNPNSSSLYTYSLEGYSNGPYLTSEDINTDIIAVPKSSSK